MVTLQPFAKEHIVKPLCILLRKDKEILIKIRRNKQELKVF